MLAEADLLAHEDNHPDAFDYPFVLGLRIGATKGAIRMAKRKGNQVTRGLRFMGGFWEGKGRDDPA